MYEYLCDRKHHKNTAGSAGTHPSRACPPPRCHSESRFQMGNRAGTARYFPSSAFGARVGRVGHRADARRARSKPQSCRPSAPLQTLCVSRLRKYPPRHRGSHRKLLRNYFVFILQILQGSNSVSNRLCRKNIIFMKNR